MFEKEAEEYVLRDDIVTENDRVPFDNGYGYQTVDFEKEVKKAFKDGAEFGYNKANEWHYVKDGDLPNTELGIADVTVAYINAYGNLCRRDCCFDGTNFIYWVDRKPVGWEKVDILGKIYAWKHLEKLPELPKESK